MKNTHIISTNEILGCLLAHDSKDDANSLKIDPSAYIYSKYNIDASALDITVAENSNDSVHLTLPYYGFLEGLDANEIDDKVMEEITGGDFFLGLGLLFAVIGGAIAGTAWVGGTAYGISYAVNSK